MIYKALKHKVTGEWGYVQYDNPAIISTEEPYLLNKGVIMSAFNGYKFIENYELVTVELREVGEDEQLRRKLTEGLLQLRMDGYLKTMEPSNPMMAAGVGRVVEYIIKLLRT